MTALSPSTPTAEPPFDCRCLCGSLLARLVPEGVELRCRRCKRTMLVPLDPGVYAAPAADRPTRFVRVEARGPRAAG